jgi:predicted nucleotidyltransferase
MAGNLLLGPEARQAILARTHLCPSREYYLRELIRLTGFAPRTVQEEVDRLVEGDLLEERRSGNRRYLKAKERHPLFRAIREIVIRTVGLVDVLRDALGARGIDFALVFGSMADGTAQSESDIDLLVVGSIGLRETVRRLTSAQDRLQREINPVVWTRMEFQRRLAESDHFLANALRSPTLMVVGSSVAGVDEQSGNLGGARLAQKAPILGPGGQ